MNFLSIGRIRSRNQDDDDDDRGRERSSRSLTRSLSPWRKSSKSRSRNRQANSTSAAAGNSARRDPSAEGMRADDTDGESEAEGRPMPAVTPSNAFESDDDSDDDLSHSDGASVGTGASADEDDYEYDDDEFELDEEVERNTEANASADTPYDFLKREGLTSDGLKMIYPGEGPNLLPTDTTPGSAGITSFSRKPPAPSSPAIGSGSASSPSIPQNAARVNPRTGLLPRRKSTRSTPAGPRLELKTGRPVFEKNRCTVTLTHGDPEKALAEKGGKKKCRRYLVASDLSEESMYAIQWAVGTVLREGDECIIVSVMETESKLDSDDSSSASARQAKQANQRERQTAALQLARQATSLLERTRLNVRVVCQAIHAKVPRHMLVDMIDYLEPTLVLVGSRGLTRLKGMLLGSTSNYLVQKSSAPVMVTRRPLRTSRTVHRKLASLDRTPRVSLADAAIEKDSNAQAVDQPEEGHVEGENVKEEVKGMSMGSAADQ
ncbi:hypothetical protein JCM8547_004886 [Rhodosporidiobolus lusitaniae]